MDWPLLDENTPAGISFHSENIDFSLKDENHTRTWVEKIFENEDKSFAEINYIFCDDTYLLKKNQTYLQHDTLTDIITFQYDDSPISGDIFISIDRVKENAKDRALSFFEELSRVMAHGILHLCGYGDKDEASKKIMRQKEEECILRILHL